MALAAALSACITVPELDRADDPDLANGAYPQLDPLKPLLATTVDPVVEAGSLETDLDARVTALRARAARLSGDPVIDPATRKRLTEASAR